MAAVLLWRPSIVALQEVGGGDDSLGHLGQLLSDLGYEAAGLAGERGRSAADGHRRGGVLLAWRRAEFAAEDAAGSIITARGARTALLLRGAIHRQRDGARITSAVADAVGAYAGRRALGVKLVRRKGPEANQALTAAVVYVPAAASPAVRAAFIRIVGERLEEVAGHTGGRFVALGDWQAAPGPAWRANAAANGAHDEAIRERFWNAGPARVGAVVDPELPSGRFTFHSTVDESHDRTIDHVFVDLPTLGRWRADGRGGGFLGGEASGKWSRYAPFDHRVGLFWRDEGSLAVLGEGRQDVHRIAKAATNQVAKFARGAANFRLTPGATSDVHLAELEAHVAAAAAQVKHTVAPDPTRPRAQPADSPAVRLAYLKGLHALVSAYYVEEQIDEAAAHKLFSARGNSKLYRAVILRKVRDAEAKRMARKGVSVGPTWRQLRDACEHRLRSAVERLQPAVAAAERARRRAVLTGVAEPASAQEMADRLRECQRRVAGRGAAKQFKLAALRDPDSEAGEVERAADGVHRIAQRYGAHQNREGRADDEAFELWLRAFVPRGEELRMPDGQPWTVRRALPEPVFRREMLLQKRGKAAGLHPFLIEQLQVLPHDHPAVLAFIELQLRCMEDGVYPAHYLEIIAVLIPKKDKSLLDMELLRDIWLINHGAKVAERCLLHTALVPAGRRLLHCHAGGCRGRGCTEHAFALHALIADGLARRRALYVMYVDLTKCFMSFSRSAGKAAMRHLGVPAAAIHALSGLVQNWKHGVARGRYETAFGATDTFDILRGFLQGAQGSPEACKMMMDTIAQALELKVQGYQAFSPDGAGDAIVQLIFVDDAANVVGDVPMLRRVALFWSIWCRITDCQANIKGASKTVVCGIEYRRAKSGSLEPVSTKARIYIGGLERGEAARRVPTIAIDASYDYCGMPTRLDGGHHNLGMRLIRRKIEEGVRKAAAVPSNRRTAVGVASAYVMGAAFFYGTCFGGSFDEVEKALGPLSRRAVQSGAVQGPRRCKRAPRLQVHAPTGALVKKVNDGLSERAFSEAGPAAFIPGYNQPHPWPCMMAATAMTFHNALASPLWTPAAAAAHRGLARVLWEFGVRASPCSARIGHLAGHLDLHDPVERAVALSIKVGRDGQLRLVDCRFLEASPLRDERWPGYPDGWTGLWAGELHARLKREGAGFSRVLARAGVAELANLCSADGSRFLTFKELRAANPRVTDHDVGRARTAHGGLVAALRALGVQPVQGRAGWAMADAALQVTPEYAASEFGSVSRALANDQARVIRSGDGAEALAAHLDIDLDPPEGEEEDTWTAAAAAGEAAGAESTAAGHEAQTPDVPRPGGPRAAPAPLRAEAVAEGIPDRAVRVRFQRAEGQEAACFEFGARHQRGMVLRHEALVRPVARLLAAGRYAAYAGAFWSQIFFSKYVHDVFTTNAIAVPRSLWPLVDEAVARGVDWSTIVGDEPQYGPPSGGGAPEEEVAAPPTASSPPSSPCDVAARVVSGGGVAAARGLGAVGGEPLDASELSAGMDAGYASSDSSVAEEERNPPEGAERRALRRAARRLDSVRAVARIGLPAAAASPSAVGASWPASDGPEPAAAPGARTAPALGRPARPGEEWWSEESPADGDQSERAAAAFGLPAATSDPSALDADGLPGAEPATVANPGMDAAPGQFPGARPGCGWWHEEVLEVDESPWRVAWASAEAARPPLATDETCRVIRAADAFGVLLITLCERAPPSDPVVHRAFVEARDRLSWSQRRERVRWRAAAGPRRPQGAEPGRWAPVHGPVHPRMVAARRAVNDAWYVLRGRAARLRLWTRWYEERRGPPTRTLRCPIDAEALRALVDSPAGRAPGKTAARTVADEARELLAHAVADGAGSRLAWLELVYRHAERGARMVAAGFLRYSREYADAADPFSCARPVREAAWARISTECDVVTCYPAIQLACFETRSPLAALLVARPKEVRRAVGRHLLDESVVGDDARYEAAKSLLNRLDNGGTLEAWRREQGRGLRARADAAAELAVAGGPAASFNLAAFTAEQEERNRWLGQRCPALIEFAQALNESMGEGDRRHVLTAKSYILQDYEGAARAAASEWARQTGAQVINLQHDGLLMRLSSGWSDERALRALTAACTEALGFDLRVAVKGDAARREALAWVEEPAIPAAVRHPARSAFVPAGQGAHRPQEERERLVAAMALAAGEAQPRAAVERGLAGADRLDLDGRRRREVLSYDDKRPVAAREWHSKVQGGHHRAWEGRGKEWLERVRAAYRIHADGKLKGNPYHSDVPLAARFWWACEAITSAAGKKANVIESAFIFDKLCELEAAYPVTHFVASDGSKGKRAEDQPVHLGRACVVMDAAAATKAITVGGQLDLYADGFEQHSYETELAAFHDHLAGTRDTVTVFVTDCLSGAQAGHAFGGRTAAGRASCYRDKLLDDLDHLEQRHRAVIYMHVHSHQGIVPNEAADVEADRLRDEDFLPIDLLPSRHALCHVDGVKRGIGRAVYDMCVAEMLAALRDASQFTLWPSKQTWAPFRGSPVRAKVMTEATFDTLQDARANRCGLLADEQIDDPAPPPRPGDFKAAEQLRSRRPRKGTWGWWCQRHCRCPCCHASTSGSTVVAGLWQSGTTQSRCHTLFDCPHEDNARPRAKAAGWLSENLLHFGRGAPHWALAALSGASGQLSEEQRGGALQFCLGLPQRGDEEDDGRLAQAYGRGFLRWIADILRGARRTSLAAKRGAPKKTNAVRFTVICYKGKEHVLERPAPRSVWMASRGLDEVWQNAQMVRKVFAALRLRSLTAGPEARELRRAAQLEAGGQTPPRASQGPHQARRELVHCADDAFDAWRLRRLHGALLVRMLPEGSERQAASLVALKRAARALVWLRQAGIDPQAKRDAAERREGAAAAKEARIAAKIAAADERARARRAARAAELEREAQESAAASAAVNRPKRSNAAAVLAAIDTSRAVCQRTELDEESGATGAPARERTPLRHKCGQGHILQEAAFASAAGVVRCDGPCGRVLVEGQMRFFCPGDDCDVDICADCIAGRPADAPQRRGGGHRCPRRHPLQFCQVQGEDDRVTCCDGACGARLRAGAWHYTCGGGCDYEICVSCEVDEAREGVTVIAAGVKRGRPAAPPRGEGRRSERQGGSGREGEGGEGGACDGQGGEAEGPRKRKMRRHIL